MDRSETRAKTAEAARLSHPDDVQGKPLNPNYVQALNLIDVVFDSKDSEKEVAVRTDWKVLLDHLEKNKGKPNFLDEIKTHTAKLLSDMGACLGYKFDEVYLKRHAYQPEAHAFIEDEQQTLRTLALQVLRGNRRIPVAFFPDDFPALVLPPDAPTMVAARAAATNSPDE